MADNARTKKRRSRIISVLCGCGIIVLLVMMIFSINKPDQVALGHELYLQEDYKSAIDYYDKAIKENPKNAAAYHNRGLTYYSLGNEEGSEDTKLREKAIADYSKSIELDPGYIDAYYDRGIAYLDYVHHYNKPFDKETIKKYDNALADFNKALELDPGYIIAHAGKGNAYYRNGSETWKKALDEYDKALADKKCEEWILNKAGEKGLAGVYSSRARTYKALMDIEKSSNDYSVSIKLNPKCMTTISHYANNFAMVGDWKNSIKMYSKGIDLIENDPKFADYPYGSGMYNGRALANFELAKYKDAIKDYNLVLDKYKNFGSKYAVHKQLGLIYTNLGDQDKAQQEFRKAAEEYTTALDKKKTPNLYQDRGYCYLEIGEYEKAKADFLKTLELDPPASDGMFLERDYEIEAKKELGVLCSRTGDLGKAKEYLKNALTLAQKRDNKDAAEEIKELLSQL